MNRCHPASGAWEEQETCTRHRGHPPKINIQPIKDLPRSSACSKITSLSLAVQAVSAPVHPRGKARLKLFPPKVQTRVLLAVSPGEVKWGDVSRVWI